MTLLVGRIGVFAIPVAFAVMAGAKALDLGVIMLAKIQRGTRLMPVHA